ILLRAARRTTLVLVVHRHCPALGRSREDREKVVGLRGLEPLTSSLSGKRSNRLSYRPVRHLQRAQYLQVDSHRRATPDVTPPLSSPAKRSRRYPRTAQGGQRFSRLSA